MIDYIKTNITWIKDAVGALVSVLTVTIAFFTYRKAKSTLFQPLRSEVIKHQMTLFEKIVEVLNPISFMSYIDYQTVVAVNLYLHLRKYGVTLGEDTDKEVDDAVGGEIIIDKSNITLFPPLMLNADPYEGERYPLNTDAKKVQSNREQALQGNIKIDEILLSKDFIKAESELKDIMDNPWLPKTIHKEIAALLKDVQFNLSTILPQAVKCAITEFCETAKQPMDETKGFVPAKLLNYVLINGKRHEKQLNKIQKKIKKYLRVDRKW